MTDRELMQAAIALAREAAADGEVPVGAVVTRNGEIVSVGRNRREKDKNALAHAEIEAIDRACKALGGWRLWECELFVTLEPCPMCAGAIINSRIKRVVVRGIRPESGLVRVGKSTCFLFRIITRPRSRADLCRTNVLCF